MTTINTVAQVAAYLDHSLLQPVLGVRQITADIRELARFRLGCFCVKPAHVREAAALVREFTPAGVDPTPVCSVVGFPHGNSTPAIKAMETAAAIDDGAREIDMVVHVANVLEGRWDQVRDDIAAVQGVTAKRGAILKVIFETDFIADDAAKIRLCRICTELKADFVKTSTGFGFRKLPDGSTGYIGATEHDMALMRGAIGPGVKIKPAGGIRTLDGVLRYIELGASRIGTGSTALILRQAAERFGDGSAGSAPAGRASDAAGPQGY